MKNTLGDLNNHLFAQLEKLGDDDLTGEELESELKRTDAICDISEQIIKNGELQYKAMKHISSYARELYILDAQKGPFEPDDIRQCVYIEKREIMGQEYVDCKPAYCRKRWYMAGGNILYTSDSRFKQITGISYPIAIHDRYEGR